MSWYETAPSAAVKTLEPHEHTIDPLVEGELRCGTCGGRLVIVCQKKGCKDPLERVRKSKGPVPPAPANNERKRKVKALRRCKECPQFIPRGSAARLCNGCKAKRAPVPRAREALPEGKKRCTRCSKIKPFSDFYFNKGKPYSNCKPCWNQYLANRAKEKTA